MSGRQRHAPVVPGPFTGGAPADAIEVLAPRLDQFGVKELRRAAQVATVFGIELAGIAPAALIQRRHHVAQLTSEAVVDAFERLGPTFVKLGQLVASSPMLFPPTLAEACRRTLDHVEPVGIDRIRDVVAEDLGVDPSEAFADIDPEPLSAASIAQVHACTLHDGREAVLKVRRPGIGGRMNVDLRVLRLAAGLAEHLPWLALVNPSAIVADLHRVSNEELNFALEADRLSRFRANLHAFGDNADVMVPEVHWELCGPRVICMERVYGTPIDRYRGDPAVGQRLLREAVKAWLEAACVHGPFHGDLHAGNLWILDDGRIAFLDFGIMGELPGAWRGLLRQVFVTAILGGDFTELLSAVGAVGLLDNAGGSDPVLVEQAWNAAVPLLGQSVSSVNVGEAVQLAISTMTAMGVVVPAELVLVAKQILYVERYVSALAPDWQLGRDPYLVGRLVSS